MASLEVEKAPSAGTASEETMIFNISLTNWGRIVGKLMILYVFLGCYFTMLLYTGFAVRSTDYLRLPSKYFGDFERNYAHASIQEGKDPVVYKTNIPTGCSATGETITFPDRAFQNNKCFKLSSELIQITFYKQLLRENVFQIVDILV